VLSRLRAESLRLLVVGGRAGIDPHLSRDYLGGAAESAEACQTDAPSNNGMHASPRSELLMVLSVLRAGRVMPSVRRTIAMRRRIF
jgi:hypothetical protein